MELRITVNMDGAALTDHPVYELARLLNNAHQHVVGALQASDTTADGSCYDSNGNAVATWALFGDEED